MQQELSGWEYWRAVIAKWIVINIASRISPLAVIALCLEVSDLYMQREFEEMGPIEE